MAFFPRSIDSMLGATNGRVRKNMNRGWGGAGGVVCVEGTVWKPPCSCWTMPHNARRQRMRYRQVPISCLLLLTVQNLSPGFSLHSPVAKQVPTRGAPQQVANTVQGSNRCTGDLYTPVSGVIRLWKTRPRRYTDFFFSGRCAYGRPPAAVIGAPTIGICLFSLRRLRNPPVVVFRE